MPFVKGQSGNPLGRPKTRGLKKGVRERMKVDQVYWEQVDAILANARAGNAKALEIVRSALDGPELKAVAVGELSTEQLLEILEADSDSDGD